MCSLSRMACWLFWKVCVFCKKSSCWACVSGWKAILFSYLPLLKKQLQHSSTLLYHMQPRSIYRKAENGLSFEVKTGYAGGDKDRTSTRSPQTKHTVWPRSPPLLVSTEGGSPASMEIQQVWVSTLASTDFRLGEGEQIVLLPGQIFCFVPQLGQKLCYEPLLFPHDLE